MDRIDGSPLGEYVRARGLPVADTVRLVLAVCRGVQHAHARGVVHRDLKPANVLVTEVDGRPAPRIIDFGIAKLFEADDGVRPFATDPGRMVGTPGYMSPEQRIAGGVGVAVDARADVFALGVTLFELLVGERPWAGDALPDAAEPPRASAARRRHSKGGAADAVARQLRGDIDRILAKALQHAPAERYADAGALADDLERHLAGRGHRCSAARSARYGGTGRVGSPPRPWLSSLDSASAA
jgi:serine/threonine protein kinase